MFVYYIPNYGVATSGVGGCRMWIKMGDPRENLMARLYAEADGKSFPELLDLYLKQAMALGFGESGIVMRTVYHDLIDRLREPGDTVLTSPEMVQDYLQECRDKKLRK